MRTALLLGATGLTGKHCLDILLNEAEYEKVIVLTRRSLSVSHPKLQQHIVDFNKLDDYAELIKADDVFCCLGTTIKIAGSKQAFRKVDVEYPQAVAEIALANGAKQFLVISAPESSANSPLFYGRAKAEMEQGVRKLPYAGISIFRPSLLIGERHTSRMGEGLAIKALNTFPWLLPKKLKKFTPIEARAVARAMVLVAKASQKGYGAYPSDQIQLISDSGKVT